jgi:hypothetical protein
MSVDVIMGAICTICWFAIFVDWALGRKIDRFIACCAALLSAMFFVLMTLSHIN